MSSLSSSSFTSPDDDEAYCSTVKIEVQTEYPKQREIKQSEIGDKKPVLSNKTDFSIRGFDHTSDIKLPELTGKRVLDYLKWSDNVIGKLEQLNVQRFVLWDEQKCYDDALAQDDGVHTQSAVMRVYQTIHSKLAASLKQATKAQLGQPFFKRLEKLQNDQETLYIGGQRPTPPFITGNAYLLWKAIKDQLNRRSESEIQQYVDRLYGLSYKPGTDPMVLRQNFDELVEQLTILGYDFTNRRAKLAWMQYIPKELSGIKQYFQAKGSFTIDEICDALYRHFVENPAAKGPKTKAEQPTGSVNALAETPGPKGQGKPDKKGDKKGENKPGNPNPSGKPTDGPKKFEKKHCTHCKVDTHNTDRCLKKKNEELEAKLEKVMKMLETHQIPTEDLNACFEVTGLTDSTSESGQIFMAIEATDPPPCVEHQTGMIILDSGVTRHHLRVQLEAPTEDLDSIFEINGSFEYEDSADSIFTATEHTEDLGSLSHAEVDKNKWTADSGAQRNVTPFLDVLINVTKLDTPVLLGSANGTIMKATHKGSVRISRHRVLHDVLYLPQAKKNLLSEGSLVKGGSYIYKDAEYMYLMRKPLKLAREDYFLRIKRNPDNSFYEFTRKVDNKGRDRTDLDEPKTKILQYAAAPRPKPKPSDDNGPPVPPENPPVVRRTIPKKIRPQPAPSGSVNSVFSVEEVKEWLLLLSEVIPGELSSLSTTPLSTVELLHRRLGHVGHNAMLRLARTKKIHVPEREIHNFFKTGKPPCCFDKLSTRKPVRRVKDPTYKATRIAQIMHGDLVGPISLIDRENMVHKKCNTFNNESYVHTSVDEAADFLFADPCTTKDKAREYLKANILYVENKTGLRYQSVRHDRAKDYLNQDMDDFCKLKGISQAPTPAYSPALNGLVERANRTIFDIARPLLLQSNAHPKLWGEAARHAAFIHNITPSSRLDGATPYERLFNYHFDPEDLKTFGCDAHVMYPPPLQAKTQKKTWDGIYLGFDKDQSLHRILKLDSHKVSYEKHVVFAETSFQHMARLLKQSPNKNVSPYNTRQNVMENGRVSPTDTSPQTTLLTDNRYRFLSGDLDDDDEEAEDSDPYFQVNSSRSDDAGSIPPSANLPSDPHSMGERKSPSDDDCTHASTQDSSQSNAYDVEDYTNIESSAGNVAFYESPTISQDKPQTDRPSQPAIRKESQRSQKNSKNPQNIPADSSKTQGSKEPPTKPKIRELGKTELNNLKWQNQLHNHWNKEYAPSSAQTRASSRRQSMISSAQATATSSLDPIGSGSTEIQTDADDSKTEELSFIEQLCQAFENAPNFRSQPSEHILQVVEQLLALAHQGSDPQSRREALKSAFAKEWMAAEKVEVGTLDDMGTFEVVRLPAGAKALPSHMVYKTKKNSDGSIAKHKARLVAGGHRQVYGRDYDETFSPTPKMRSLKLVVALAGHFDLELHQLDYTAAFTHADIGGKDVYIRPPEGWQSADKDIVWKLVKSLYGLKQAGRNWNQAVDALYRSLGYKPLIKDPCIYVKVSRTGKPLILPLYVDDCIPAFHIDDKAEWGEIKAKIFSTFKGSDLGECEWILNMKIIRDRKNRTIILSQEQYTKDLLSRFDMLDSKPDILPHLSEPIQMKASDTEEGVPLNPDDHQTYRSIIGALLYLANLTRIDICFQVNRLSQFCHAPRMHHLIAAKRVLRYLAGTCSLSLIFRGSHQETLEIHAYSDADWATDHTARKSVSGNLIQVSGNLISWTSKKQTLTAQSTMEAELIAANESVRDILWFQDWIEEIYGYRPESTIFCDNTSTITSSTSDKDHQRTRHIDIRYHMIKDHIKNGNTKIEYVNTEDQLADMLTKPLQKDSFLRFRDLFLVKT